MTRKVYDGDGSCYINHDGVKRQTDKAKLFSIHGEEFWIPQSLIEDENEEIVAVPRWWADKNNLESDW